MHIIKKKADIVTHIVFLFSCPTDQAQIDYNKEFYNMQIERMKKRVLFKKMVATVENFQKTLSEAPISLHFSGHGFRES